MIDPIILGHNQFFGVNHLDAQAGNNRGAFFSDTRRIIEMVNFCYDCGVHALMMSTHERALMVSKKIQADKRLLEGLGIYLLVPYAAKYIRKANEKGLVNVVTDSLQNTSLMEKFTMFWRGGIGLVRKDINIIIKTMIDFEVAPFSYLKLKAVFLHDIPTDLILGWNVPEAFETFASHVQKKYNAIPAFCTKNLPRLVKVLKSIGMENPLVMASINKAGYQVNPSLEAFESCIRSETVRLLAMSTLAAGYLKPKEAYEYLYSLPNVVSTVVGVSKKEHASETFSIINQHLDQTVTSPNREILS